MDIQCKLCGKTVDHTELEKGKCETCISNMEDKGKPKRKKKVIGDGSWEHEEHENSLDYYKNQFNEPGGYM